MSQLIPLVAVEELTDGSSIEVVAAGRIFAVFRVDGTFHVLDGICPHAGGPLGKGQLNGCVVTCPWHGWQFDIRDGQHCLNDQLRQPRYEAEIADGQVCIRLPEA
ncbi:MAG: Rieske 2Fe-2S domain-containing protein [Planctomycetaceae bacterium]